MSAFRDLAGRARGEARRTLLVAEPEAPDDSFPHLLFPSSPQAATAPTARAVRWALIAGLSLSFAALALIVLCSIAPAASGPIVIGHSYADHHGGVVGEFAARYQAIRASGRKVEIDGPCVSACTIVASLPPSQVCITPRAVLGIHLTDDGEDLPYTAWAVKTFYPPALQAWIVRHGGLTERPKWVGYRDLLAIGFAACAHPHRWHWTGSPAPGAPDKAWWDGLASGKGLCCSFADGQMVENVDWDTAKVADATGSHIAYRVRLNGRWIVVPPDAVVTAPNRFGEAVVWPYQDGEQTKIRCFLPGAGS